MTLLRRAPILFLPILLWGIGSGAPGDVRGAVPEARWQPLKTRLVTLAEGDPLLGEIPLHELAPCSDGRFLFGRTPGYNVEISPEGVTLKPYGAGRSSGTPLRLRGPGRLRFRLRTGPKSTTEVPVEFARRDEGWAWRIPAVLEAAAAGRFLRFIDGDGDGWFDDVEDDRVASGTGPDDLSEWFPFRGVVTAGDRRFLAYADLSEAGLWPVTAATRTDYIEQAAVINDLRKQAGLGRVGLAEERTAPCEAHSLYCKTNGLSHEESAGKPGYSPQGHNAGTHACIGGGRDAADGVRGMLMTLWHRNYYLSKSLTRVGVGHAEGIVTSDVLTFGNGTAGRTQTFFPPDGSVDAETAGRDEHPNPYPGGAALAGPFITVLLPPGKKLRFVSGSIVPRGGEPLDFAVSDPTLPPEGAKERFPDNDACIVLIPRRTLDPGAIYDVTVKAGTAARPTVFTWSFRTRDAAKDPADR